MEKQEIKVAGYTIFVSKSESLKENIIEFDRRYIPAEHIELVTEMFGEDSIPTDEIFDKWFKNETNLEHDPAFFSDPLFSGCDNE